MKSFSKEQRFNMMERKLWNGCLKELNTNCSDKKDIKQILSQLRSIQIPSRSINLRDVGALVELLCVQEQKEKEEILDYIEFMCQKHCLVLNSKQRVTLLRYLIPLLTKSSGTCELKIMRYLLFEYGDRVENYQMDIVKALLKQIDLDQDIASFHCRFSLVFTCLSNFFTKAGKINIDPAMLVQINELAKNYILNYSLDSEGNYDSNTTYFLYQRRILQKPIEGFCFPKSDLLCIFDIAIMISVTCYAFEETFIYPSRYRDKCQGETSDGSDPPGYSEKLQNPHSKREQAGLLKLRQSSLEFLMVALKANFPILGMKAWEILIPDKFEKSPPYRFQTKFFAGILSEFNPVLRVRMLQVIRSILELTPAQPFRGERRQNGREQSLAFMPMSTRISRKFDALVILLEVILGSQTQPIVLIETLEIVGVSISISPHTILEADKSPAIFLKIESFLSANSPALQQAAMSSIAKILSTNLPIASVKSWLESSLMSSLLYVKKWTDQEEFALLCGRAFRLYDEIAIKHLNEIKCNLVELFACEEEKKREKGLKSLELILESKAGGKQEVIYNLFAQQVLFGINDTAVSVQQATWGCVLSLNENIWFQFPYELKTQLIQKLWSNLQDHEMKKKIQALDVLGSLMLLRAFRTFEYLNETFCICTHLCSLEAEMQGKGVKIVGNMFYAENLESFTHLAELSLEPKLPISRMLSRLIELADGDNKVSALSVRALIHLCILETDFKTLPRIIFLLEEKLKSEVAKMRWTICYGLGYLARFSESVKLVPMFASQMSTLLLCDPNFKVRCSALSALKEMIKGQPNEQLVTILSSLQQCYHSLSLSKPDTFKDYENNRTLKSKILLTIVDLTLKLDDYDIYKDKVIRVDTEGLLNHDEITRDYVRKVRKHWVD